MNSLRSQVFSIQSWSAPNRVRLGILIFLIWTIVGLTRSLPYALQESEEAWSTFEKLLDAWMWAVLTPAFLWADKNLIDDSAPAFMRALILGLLSIPFSAAHLYLTAAVQYPIAGIWWSPFRSPEFYPHYFVGGWITYVAMAGIMLALTYYRRYLTSQLKLERMEKQFLESHLNALRLQLEPHFLFNALNAISSEIDRDGRRARDMISNLAELLRHSLAFAETAEITLSQELKLLDHYLAIQRVRFGDRIHINMDVAPEVKSAVVPCMLLQPLVENAIRHGIESRIEGGTVTISARRSGNSIDIRVIDDGVGLPPNWRADRSAGLGLKVTRERLEGLYGAPPEDLLQIQRAPNGGTQVEIRVPLRKSQEDKNVPLSGHTNPGSGC